MDKEKEINVIELNANVIDAGAIKSKSLTVDAGGINIGGITLTIEDIKKLKNLK